jgi:hypothetical protein
MLDAGIPKMTLLLAIRKMESAMSTRFQVDETAEKRRAWDREYRRRTRDRPPDPPDIHPTTPDIATSLSKEEESLSVNKERKQESKKERGCKIPPDWKPNESHYAEGSERGLDRDRVNALAQDMRIWCDANSNRSVTTKSNWNSTFLGWVRREKSTGKPLTEFQRKQAETNDVRSQLRNVANGSGRSGEADRVLSIDNGQRPQDVRGGIGPNIFALPGASGRGGH